MTRSSFVDNTADDVGGAIGFFGTTGRLTRSYLGTNSATNGGGALYVANTETVTIANSTFQGNGANDGGALLTQGQVTARYNTFASNTSTTGGQVVSIQAGGVTWTGNLMVYQARPCSGSGTTDGGYNVFDGPGTACAMLTASTDRLNADVSGISGAAAANGGDTLTVKILAGSSATDVGDTSCVGVDQNGEPRPATVGPGAATCDAGAYEIPNGSM